MWITPKKRKHNEILNALGAINNSVEEVGKTLQVGFTSVVEFGKGNTDELMNYFSKNTDVVIRDIQNTIHLLVADKYMTELESMKNDVDKFIEMFMPSQIIKPFQREMIKGLLEREKKDV